MEASGITRGSKSPLTRIVWNTILSWGSKTYTEALVLVPCTCVVGLGRSLCLSQPGVFGLVIDIMVL